MTTKPFVRKVAALIEDRHWTQEQFGRLLGVSKQRINWLLNESKKPDPLTVQRFAKELHVSMEELVDDRGFWRMVQ